MAVKHFIVFGILLAKSFGSGVPVPSQTPETAEKEAGRSAQASFDDFVYRFTIVHLAILDLFQQSASTDYSNPEVGIRGKICRINLRMT